MTQYELGLASGKTVVWDGKDGKDAAQRYVDAHPTEAVTAWREAERHGFYPFNGRIVEPGQ
jgi:hypothetical protein